MSRKNINFISSVYKKHMTLLKK